jgi:hypothetical protein
MKNGGREERVNGGGVGRVGLQNNGSLVEIEPVGTTQEEEKWEGGIIPDRDVFWLASSQRNPSGSLRSHFGHIEVGL